MAAQNCFNLKPFNKIKEKRIKMKKTILTALIVISSIGLFAQPVPPPYAPNGHGNNDDQAAGAPIDGGLSILLIMGAAFGAKKIQLLKKKATAIE